MTSLILNKDAQPVTGFKMIKRADGTFCIAVLKIPATADVIKTSYRAQLRGKLLNGSDEDIALYRTNSAIVVNIKSNSTPETMFIEGYSIKNACFQYIIGKPVEEELMKTSCEDGPGVHFFINEKFAKMWQVLLK